MSADVFCARCHGLIGGDVASAAACICAAPEWIETVKNMLAKDIVRATTYGRPGDSFARIVDTVTRDAKSIHLLRTVCPRTIPSITIDLGFMPEAGQEQSSTGGPRGEGSAKR